MHEKPKMQFIERTELTAKGQKLKAKKCLNQDFLDLRIFRIHLSALWIKEMG